MHFVFPSVDAALFLENLTLLPLGGSICGRPGNVLWPSWRTSQGDPGMFWAAGSTTVVDEQSARGTYDPLLTLLHLYPDHLHISYIYLHIYISWWQIGPEEARYFILLARSPTLYFHNWLFKGGGLVLFSLQYGLTIFNITMKHQHV